MSLNIAFIYAQIIFQLMISIINHMVKVSNRFLNMMQCQNEKIYSTFFCRHSIEDTQPSSNACNQPKKPEQAPNVSSSNLISQKSSTHEIRSPSSLIRPQNQPNRPEQTPNASNSNLLPHRSSINNVHSPPPLIKLENRQQMSNESGEKATNQNVPVSMEDFRKGHGVKRVRFDVPTEKENVSSSEQQITTISNSQSNFSVPTTQTNSVKVIPITPDQIQNLSNTPGIRLIPVTPNQVQSMSSPGVLIAIPAGSSEAPIQILTPNSSAVINKVVISPFQPQTTGAQNIGSLSTDPLSTRATSDQMPNSSNFQYILPKPPSVTPRMPEPLDPEIEIKDEYIDSVESLDIKSELDSEADVDTRATDTSETLTASDTSETLTASETEEICEAMDKRSLSRCKKVRFFGDIQLDDLRSNCHRAYSSWDIIQKTVKKHRELIEVISEENEDLTKQINKISNTLKMSPSWEAVDEEPKIIEPSPSGSSSTVAKKLSFWKIEKQD
nr:unnamed protein product [Callosobruchus analis]